MEGGKSMGVTRTSPAIPLIGLIVLVFTGPVMAQTLWTEDGITVCGASGHQWNPQIVADDSGGVIIAWHDGRGSAFDIYAQRIDADGIEKWTIDGATVCTIDSSQWKVQMCSDGASGAIIVWEDLRYHQDDTDIYIQKIDASGTTQWTFGGVAVCTHTQHQTELQIIEDGVGGAILVWKDKRHEPTNGDIYAQRINSAGALQWSGGIPGNPVCLATDDQYGPQLTSDDSNGAIIAWADYRNGHYDIYAQRVAANGDTLWPADGVAICTAADDQYEPQLVSDGAGGAILVWEDFRTSSDWYIYAQRIDADGNTLWRANGVALSDTTGDSGWYQQIITDGSGGAIVVWADKRAGNWDIYAQRIDADGNIRWRPTGMPICTAPGVQNLCRLAHDGSGGAVIAWTDERSGFKKDIYAQRIDADGDTLLPADGIPICTALNNQVEMQLVGDGSTGAVLTWADSRDGISDWNIWAQWVRFDPAPTIVSIADVPGDQGGQVAIEWNRSYLDKAQYNAITDYTIWRQYPPGTKIESIGRKWDGTLPTDRSDRVYQRIERTDQSGQVKTDYWEYIGLVEATHLEGYAYIAPTLEDSSAGGTPFFLYFVSANTSDPFTHWHSAPESGYSVDDISPAKTTMTIAHGSGKSAKGSLDLSWQQVTTGEDGSPETGPILYHLYCDTTAHFTPGTGNLLTTTQNLSYQHSDARIGDPNTDLFYLVKVSDGSGNLSEVSNRTGEIDFDLKTTTGTDYTWVSLALEGTGLAMASDLEASIEAHSSPATNCLTVSEWNPVAQAYTHYTTVPIPMGDFPLTAGGAYRVELTGDAVWTLAGGVPAAGAVSFDLETTTGTDYTWVSLPLELDALTMASDLEAHIESNSDPVTGCLTVSQWNPVAQTYTHYTTVPIPMGDFAIRPGRAYRVEVTAEAAWPYSGKGLRKFQRVLRTR
jgi:hypothetical protein